jgi:hypothetical protein
MLHLREARRAARYTALFGGTCLAIGALGAFWLWLAYALLPVATQ